MKSIFLAIDSDQDEIKISGFEALDEIPFVGYEYLDNYLD